MSTVSPKFKNRSWAKPYDGKLPRLKKALFADSTAIVAGAALGTSATTPYIESASGVAAGGRTGLTAGCGCFTFHRLLILGSFGTIRTRFCNCTSTIIYRCVNDSRNYAH